jgi:hypothetical protein
MNKGLGNVFVLLGVFFLQQVAQAEEFFIRGGGGSQPVTISNDGDPGSILQVSAMVIDDDTHFSLVSGGTCASPPFNLIAGDECTQMVAFTPQNFGTHTATLQVLSDAGEIDNDLVALSGTALPGPQPEITITPNPMNFGLVDAAQLPVLDEFTVTNTGDPDTAFTINALDLIDDDAFFIQSDGCSGLTLFDGDFCTINIGFNTSETGNFSGQLTVQTDEGNASASILASTQVPDRLAFVQQPTTTMINDTISPAVMVEVRDENDDLVALDDSTVIELQLGMDPTGQADLSGTLQLQVTGGQAAFNDLSINQVGTGFALSVSAGGLAGDDSQSFDIIAGQPAALAFVDQPPAATTVGQVFATTVSVEVLDSFGNRVDWDNDTEVMLELSGGDPAAQLAGGEAVTVISGLASFPGLSVDRVAEGYQLVALDAGQNLSSASSDPFDITRAGSDTQILSIDPADEQVVGQEYTVTVQVTGFGPTGTVSVSDGNGASCDIVLPAGSCDLTSTSAGERTITASYSGDQNNQPSSDAVGYEIIRASADLDIVEIDPAGSQMVNTPYTVIVELDGFNPAGTITVNDGQGASCLIVWPDGDRCDLTSTTVGPRTIAASFPGDANNEGDSDTESYEIVAGAPASLHFIVQPSDTESQAVMVPAVEVEVRDSAGNPVTQDNDTEITLSLIDGAPGAQLEGGEAVQVSNGVAVFDALSVDLAAGNYRLRAGAGGLADGLSEPFQIFPGEPAQLGFLGQPTTTLVDAPITPPVTVEIQDAAGNRVVDDNTTAVSLELIGGDPSALLTGGGITLPENGLVTFTGLSVDAVGVGYQLIASESLGTLTTDTSQSFNIVTEQSETTILSVNPPDSQTVGLPYFVEVEVTGATPTGTVTVDDGQGASCQFELPDDGCNLTSMTAAEISITAFYAGDENNASSSSDPFAYTITPATSFTTITGFDPPGEQTVNVAYQVSVDVSGFQPSGTVTVSDDGNNQCTITLPGSSCALTSTQVGARIITAAYSGDTNNVSSQDTDDYEIVRAETTTTILGITPPNEQLVDKSYEVTVLVSGQSPTGAVEVDDGEGASCTIDLEDGQSSCHLTSTSVGPRTITASYPGDDHNKPSQGTRSYEIVSSGPVALVFSVEPQLGVLDGPLIPRVVIQVVNSQGLPVTDDHETEVEILFETNPTDAELSGTLMATVSNGSVEFPDLSINRLGQGYQLRARAVKQALDEAVSQPFDVVTDGIFQDRFERGADEIFRDRFEP